MNASLQSLEAGDCIAISDATKALLRPVPLQPQDRIFIRLDGENFFFRVYGEDNSYPSMRAVGSWISRIPECKPSTDYSVSNSYIAAATDFTVAVIHSLWKGRIKFANDETKLEFVTLLSHLINGYEQAKHFRAYKDGCWLTKNVYGKYVDHVDYPLKRHQQYAFHNSMSTDGYGLFMEQGTGKTPVGIATACNYAMKLNSGRMKRILVVCPNNVRLNWKIEMEKFATCKHQVAIIRGTKHKRVEQFIRAFIQEEAGNEFTCVIVGYDTLRACWDYFSKVEWDLGIADESHYFKTNGNKRCKTMLKLRDKCKNLCS